MKKFIILSAFFSICAFFASAQQVPSQIVNEVIVSSSGSTDITEAEDYVLTHTSAKQGEPITQQSLAKDQRTLIDSGIFSDVRIYLKSASNGVDVIYEVTVAPRLRAPVNIIGNKKFSTGKIKSLLDFDNGDYVTSAVIADACDKLVDAYKKSYYNNAKVSYSLSERDNDGFASLSVTIDEGAREKLATFEFSGNKNISSTTLRGVLGRPSPYNPFKYFYSQWRIDAFNHALVRDRITNYYRSLGFLDVEVGTPAIVRNSDSDSPVMHISIREGCKYSFMAASVSGVTLFPDAEIRKTISAFARPGEPASDTAIAAAEKAINNLYSSRGYIETTISSRITPLTRASDKNETIPISLQIKVKEGFLAHIRSVKIEGNTRTKDKVIRREIVPAIAPGMLMNEMLADTSKRRLENLGYFETVRMTHVPSLEDETVRDVIFSVSEKSTGTLMCGIGTSNIDDILGYIDISQNNFRGTGQKIRISGSAGSSSNSGEISWTDPWFMDKQQALSLAIYRREYSYSEYDETRIGADATISRPLKYGRISLKLGAEIVENDDFLTDLFHPEDDLSYDYYFDKEIDNKYLRVPLRLSWLYDTRNHPFVPTRGSRNNIYAEIMNSSFGSDYDIYKIGADLRQYIPAYLGNTYFSLRLRAETVDCYGDTEEVPVNDRFFLGGARTVRGFRYREVGPKVIPAEGEGGRAHPIGGQTLAMFSAEYNIPLAKVLRFAAFYDVGNVWAESFDADFGELASSWGFGIRFDIPGFPIRLDYAFPIEHDDDYTRTERFIFSIGFE